MPNPDLDKLKAAIIFMPTGESKWQFKAMEYFLTEEGHLAYFNQPTEWPYTKDKPRPIYEMVSAPALIDELERLQKQTESALKTAKQSQDGWKEAIDEIERLRGEVATAKTLGAVEELEAEAADLEAFVQSGQPWVQLTPLNLAQIKRNRAAELRKELA